MKRNLIKIFAISMFIVVGSLGFSAGITDNISIEEVKGRLNNNEVLIAAKKANGKFVVCIPAKEATSNETLYKEAEKCLVGFSDKGAKKTFDFYVSKNLDPVRNYYFNKLGAYYNQKDLKGVTVEYYHMVF